MSLNLTLLSDWKIFLVQIVFSNFKVSKEGEGLKKVWQQHFQQFRNVSAEMAAAIVAVYPSPQSLLQVI